MSDQDPFEPPKSDMGTEPEADPGHVGWGILLAFLIMAGSLVLALGIAWGRPMTRAFGCVTLPLLALGGVPVAALIAIRIGKTKTAKGLWIGYALYLGMFALLIGGVWAICSGMKV